MISFGGGGGGGGTSGLGISTCMMTSGGAGATCAIAAIAPREPNKTASIRKPPKSARVKEVGRVVSVSRVAHKAPGRTSVVALILYGLSDRLFATRCQRHRCDTGRPYNIHCFHNFLIGGAFIAHDDDVHFLLLLNRLQASDQFGFGDGLRIDKQCA